MPNASSEPLIQPRIVLASASPRRRELLAGLGLSFDILPADIDESLRSGEDPVTYVDRLAFEKARAVAERLAGAVYAPGTLRAAGPSDTSSVLHGAHASVGWEGSPAVEATVARASARRHAGEEAPGTPLVIAADTVVIVGGEMLGKPRDATENRAFVASLSGRTHRVATGHCLMYGSHVERVVRTTEVAFRALDAEEIDRYAATGEGLDKAGGYAIQGIGAALVDRVEGCYFNVVGLSVAAVVTAARRLGVALV